MSDDAFPLRPGMINSFRQADLTSRERQILNYNCVLHNFLIEHSKKSYAPQKCFYRVNSENATVIFEGYNTQNSTMENLERRNPGNTLNNAKIVRNNFMNYFNQEGRIPWQNDHVN